MMAFAQPLTSERVMGNKAAPALDGLHRRGFAPPIVHDALNAADAPLDGAARAGLEQHVGHDLSGVRVHTGALAAASARAVGARAFTVGRDIVFGDGEYAPTTAAGRKLLAHEVAHVTQQDPNLSPAAIPIGAHDAHEERAADAVAAGAPPSRAPAGPAVLRRQDPASSYEPPSASDGNPWDPQLLWELKLRHTLGKKFGKGTRFDLTGPPIPPFGFNPSVGLGFYDNKNITGYLNFGGDEGAKLLRGQSDKDDGINVLKHGLPYGQGTGGFTPGKKNPVLPELDLRFRKPGTPPQRFGAQLLSQPNPVQMKFPKFGIDGFMRGMPNTHPGQPFLPFPKHIQSLSERMKTFLQPKTDLFQPKWGGNSKLGGNHFEPSWFQHLPAFRTQPDSKDEQEQEHDH